MLTLQTFSVHSEGNSLTSNGNGYRFHLHETSSHHLSVDRGQRGKGGGGGWGVEVLVEELWG